MRPTLKLNSGMHFPLVTVWETGDHFSAEFWDVFSR